MATTCACGAEKTPRSKRCRRCTTRLAQARYERTEKGKAAKARYIGTASHRAAVARYRATARGQQTHAAVNARRIFVGSTYRGRARTVEQAAIIQRHIKERTREFISRFQTGA